MTEDETKLEAHKSIHFCSDCGQHFGDVTSHKALRCTGASGKSFTFDPPSQAHCLGVEIPCDICHQQIARGQMAQHQQQTHKCPHCGDVVKHSPQRCPKVWCGTHSKAFPCKDCAKVNCPHCQAEQPNVAALQLHVQAEHTCQHCAGIFAANLDTHEQVPFASLSFRFDLLTACKGVCLDCLTGLPSAARAMQVLPGCADGRRPQDPRGSHAPLQELQGLGTPPVRPVPCRLLLPAQLHETVYGL